MTRWKLLFPSKYLRAVDLDATWGREATFTIKKLAKEGVQKPATKDPVSCTVVYFKELSEWCSLNKVEEKRLILIPTNAAGIEAAVGDDDFRNWPGKVVTLYIEEGVRTREGPKPAVRIKKAVGPPSNPNNPNPQTKEK